ncbi:MAG: class I SAM-dependent methyltransferase [Acidobacteriaceae bacterium]
MGFTLDKVVPWGRSYDEYVSMFGLTESDLDLRILGCGDGPAAFNSALCKRGGNVISVDPIYVFDAAQIRSRISDTYEAVMTQMRKNKSDYIWGAIPSVEQLGNVRLSAMETFLADFEIGKCEGRYIAGELPSLPFESGQFDIALSSHFLFLYSAHLSAEFHLQAIQEMLRVAHEVRVFPLLALDGTPSPHIDFVRNNLENHGFGVAVRRVPYEFQRGGNEMLVVKPV